MKKLLFLFLISGSFFTNGSIRAQSYFSVGIKGGINFLTTKVHFYNTPEEGGPNVHYTYLGNSPQIGAAIQYNFSGIGFLRLEGF